MVKIEKYTQYGNYIKKGKCLINMLDYSIIEDYFLFKNDIPDLEKIFCHYDVILPKKFKFRMSVRKQYKYYHFVKFLDLSLHR